MAFISSRPARRSLAILLQLALAVSPLLSQDQAEYTFRVESEMVLVNVTVRDKNGNFVRNLKPEDFAVLEDNKPQKVISFDLENVDAAAMQSVPQARPLVYQPSPTQPSQPALKAPSTAHQFANQLLANQFKDRRLIILFFDLSAMEPDEIDRAVTSAEHYVDTQMAPA
ncbi:MAG: VWA domain-containing protein, partial [Candidatus Sulfotelmatobacter sp.]